MEFSDWLSEPRGMSIGKMGSVNRRLVRTFCDQAWGCNPLNRAQNEPCHRLTCSGFVLFTGITRSIHPFSGCPFILMLHCTSLQQQTFCIPSDADPNDSHKEFIQFEGKYITTVILSTYEISWDPIMLPHPLTCLPLTLFSTVIFYREQCISLCSVILI